MTLANWQEPCSLSLEHWLHRRRVPFLIFSVAAGFMVVIIYRIFSFFVVLLPWDTSTISVALAMGLCLTLQLIGIPWFLTQMRESFLAPRSPEGDPVGKFYPLLISRLCERIPFYATLSFVLLPFVALNILQFMNLGGTPFFIKEHTLAGLLLDATNIILGYLLLYLLAVILWMLLVVGWTLNDAQGNPERNKVPVDIFAPDGVGGLGSIQSFMRSLLTYYFIIVTLLIISYLSPPTPNATITTLTQIFSYESLFVIMLLIIGILFFFIGFGSIRNLVRGRVADEIGSLNESIRFRYKQLKESISNGEKTDPEELKKEQSVLDICYMERNRLMTVYDKNQAFDIRTIGQSVASLIIPVLAFVVQLSSGAEAFRKIISMGIL